MPQGKTAANVPARPASVRRSVKPIVTGEKQNLTLRKRERREEKEEEKKRRKGGSYNVKGKFQGRLEMEGSGGGKEEEDEVGAGAGWATTVGQGPPLGRYEISFSLFFLSFLRISAVPPFFSFHVSGRHDRSFNHLGCKKKFKRALLAGQGAERASPCY